MGAPPLGASWSAFCVFFQHYLLVALLIRFCYWLLRLRLLLVSCPFFYRSVMTSWFRLPRHLENGEIVIGGVASCCFPLRSFTTRFTCRELSRLDATEHRTVAKYSSWGLTIEWNTVWWNLSLWQFIRPIRDTNWLIAHGYYPPQIVFFASILTSILCVTVAGPSRCICLRNAWWRGTSSWFTVLSPNLVAHPLCRSSLATSSPSRSHPLSRVLLGSSVIAYGSPATIGVLTRPPSSSALCCRA